MVLSNQSVFLIKNRPNTNTAVKENGRVQTIKFLIFWRMAIRPYRIIKPDNPFITRHHPTILYPHPFIKTRHILWAVKHILWPVSSFCDGFPDFLGGKLLSLCIEEYNYLLCCYQMEIQAKQSGRTHRFTQTIHYPLLTD